MHAETPQSILLKELMASALPWHPLGETGDGGQGGSAAGNGAGTSDPKKGDGDGAEGLPEGWTPQGLGEALERRPPLEYVVAELAPRGSLGMVFGDGASHKSNALIFLALSVASGAPWLGRFAVKPGPVAWVNVDNSTRTVLDRVAAFARGLDLPASTPFHILSFPSPPLDLTSPASVALLRRFIAKHGIALCIIDPLQSVRGAADENDSTQMAPAIANLRRLVEESGTTILLVHHCNRQGTYRGTSSLRDLVDYSIAVERSNDTATWRPDKSRFAEIPTVAMRFCFEHVPDTRELWRAWFSFVEPDAGDDALAEWIVEFVTANPGRSGRSIKEAARREGFAKHETDKALVRLEGRRIRKELGGRNSWQWFPVPVSVPVSQSVPRVSQGNWQNECPSVPIPLDWDTRDAAPDLFAAPSTSTSERDTGERDFLPEREAIQNAEADAERKARARKRDA